MSISLFMRISATAADGLAPKRSNRDHHRLNCSSLLLLGAKVLMLAPVPHPLWIRSMKAVNFCAGSTHVGK